MKKLCFKVSMFLCLLGMLIFLSGLFFRQTTTYHNTEISNETDKFHHMPDKIELSVLGSSHGRDAFNFSPYTDKSFNFSLSSQTPRYDLRLLREYKEFIADNAVIIATISYTSPFIVELDEDFQLKQTRYYQILSPQNIIDCDLPYWLLSRFSPILTEDTETVIRAFLAPPPLLNSTNSQQNFCVEQEIIDQEIE